VTVEEEVLGRIAGALDELSIPYMVTGSIAASYYGRPRATHDADIVIDPSAEQTERLMAWLEAGDFFVNVDAALEAVRHRRQFNVIEKARAVKIDLIVRKARPFSVEELARRTRLDLPFGRGIAMVTAEDAVLSKLEWARRSGDSDRQIRDAAGIVELTPTIDRVYIRKWAGALGIADLWDRVAGGAG
jgi:hypothetical protein